MKTVTQSKRSIFIFQRARSLCLLAFLSTLTIASATQGQTVIEISNAGFESPAAAGQTEIWNTPNGWSMVAGVTNGTGKSRWISGTAGNEVHSGTRAFAILNPEIGNSQYRIQQTNASRFAVESGTNYTLSVWVKGTDLDLARDRVRISIEWWNAAGTDTVGGTWTSLQTLSSNSTWQQLSVTSTAAPATAATAKILFFFDRGAASTSTDTAMITFDDIVVTKPGSIPEPSTIALICGTGVFLSVCLRRFRRTS